MEFGLTKRLRRPAPSDHPPVSHIQMSVEVTEDSTEERINNACLVDILPASP